MCGDRAGRTGAAGGGREPIAQLIEHASVALEVLKAAAEDVVGRSDRVELVLLTHRLELPIEDCDAEQGDNRNQPALVVLPDGRRDGDHSPRRTEGRRNGGHGFAPTLRPPARPEREAEDDPWAGAELRADAGAKSRLAQRWPRFAQRRGVAEGEGDLGSERAVALTKKRWRGAVGGLADNLGLPVTIAPPEHKGPERQPGKPALGDSPACVGGADGKTATVPFGTKGTGSIPSDVGSCHSKATKRKEANS